MRPDVKVQNCAECRRLCLGYSFRLWYFNLPPAEQRELPEPTAAIILGRPYCAACSAVRERTGGRAGPLEEDGGPWQQNAVRALEDG